MFEKIYEGELYCRDCGKKLIWKDVSYGVFDRFTGEKKSICLFYIYCPKDSSHDRYYTDEYKSYDEWKSKSKVSS